MNKNISSKYCVTMQQKLHRSWLLWNHLWAQRQTDMFNWKTTPMCWKSQPFPELCSLTAQCTASYRVMANALPASPSAHTASPQASSLVKEKSPIMILASSGISRSFHFILKWKWDMWLLVYRKRLSLFRVTLTWGGSLSEGCDCLLTPMNECQSTVVMVFIPYGKVQ